MWWALQEGESVSETGIRMIELLDERFALMDADVDGDSGVSF